MNVSIVIVVLLATFCLQEVVSQITNQPYFVGRKNPEGFGVRQGTLREYLPPSNTQKPRPFELPTIPTGRPQDNTIGYPSAPPGVYPPEAVTAYPSPGYPETQTTHYLGPTESPDKSQQPEYTNYPQPISISDTAHSEDFTNGPQSTPTDDLSQPEYIQTSSAEPPTPPGYPSEIPSQPFEPGPSHSRETTESTQTVSTEVPDKLLEPNEVLQPGYPVLPGEPQKPETSGYPPAGQTPQPSFDLPTQTTKVSQQEFPELTQTEPSLPFQQPDRHEDVTGYPTKGPIPTPNFSESPNFHQNQAQPTEILPGESETTPSNGVPETPGYTYEEPISPAQPTVSQEEHTKLKIDEEPFTSGPAHELTEAPIRPGDVLTSAPATHPETSSPEIETTEKHSETSFPEQTSEERTSERPGVHSIPLSQPTPSDDDLKHPPHIHALDVICDSDKMAITVEFNRQFDGVIYSKGHYNEPDCRYVGENSGQAAYEFTVHLNQCGTELVSPGDSADKSYLENILVIQNEVGIQEVWDTVRAVRCEWEKNLKKSLTASLSIGMLNQEIVTFTGDSVMARLDIQRGEGPFAPSANGLVPIGEKMTLVVSVTGASDYDLQVKACKAKDADSTNEVSLTDENGCVLKPKLFGAFQKSRQQSSTLAYAFFNAFKFPDIMDLMIECNVELCKGECNICPDSNQMIQPGRRKRDVYNQTLSDPIRVGKLLRVLLPEDLSSGEVIVTIEKKEEICVSMQTFIASTSLMISLLTTATLFSAYSYLKARNAYHKH